MAFVGLTVLVGDMAMDAALSDWEVQEGLCTLLVSQRPWVTTLGQESIGIHPSPSILRGAWVAGLCGYILKLH